MLDECMHNNFGGFLRKYTYCTGNFREFCCSLHSGSYYITLYKLAITCTKGYCAKLLQYPLSNYYDIAQHSTVMRRELIIVPITATKTMLGIFLFLSVICACRGSLNIEDYLPLCSST